MSKKMEKNLLVALDIGTSKIAVLVGEVAQDQQIEVIGFGSHPSRGLKRGVVINIESTVQSIQRAVEEAELMAGCRIQSAYTGISGSYIRSLNSHGIVAIRDREVNAYDVDRVIDAAKTVAIPADQQVLHVLPQEFIVDSQDGVKEPIGMSGVRLEARVHIVTAAVSAAQNITKCVRRCGLEVSDIILQPLASSYAVLSDEEKELGVCLIDVGAGTTDMAVFVGGAIRHTAVIPIAGDHVTNDLAVALRTPLQAAEKLKIEQGVVEISPAEVEVSVQVPSVAKRPAKKVMKRALAHVIHARYEELFALVQDELRRCGMEDYLTAGIVLTGGAARMSGVVDLAESMFKMPVRLGLPQQVSGLIDVRENPSFSTGVGLLMYGMRNHATEALPQEYDLPTKKLWSRMRHWFQGNF